MTAPNLTEKEIRALAWIVDSIRRTSAREAIPAGSLLADAVQHAESAVEKLLGSLPRD